MLLLTAKATPVHEVPATLVLEAELTPGPEGLATLGRVVRGMSMARGNVELQRP
jgi:hypothetical protein